VKVHLLSTYCCVSQNGPCTTELCSSVYFLGPLGKHFTVRLHACPEDGAFKLNRFHISKSNVRQQWFDPAMTTDSGEGIHLYAPRLKYNLYQSVKLHQETTLSILRLKLLPCNHALPMSMHLVAPLASMTLPHWEHPVRVK